MLFHRLNDDPMALDFQSVRQRLETLATQAFPAWTDHDSPGFGNVLLDLFAFVTEVLGYVIEDQGRESRLVTATRRANVLAHARMLGYKPRGATAARAALVFRLDSNANEDVLIPAGYTVRTTDTTPAITFRVIERAIVRNGEREATCMAEAAQTHTLVVDADGLPNQSYVLPQQPYLDGSVRVSDQNGDAFSEVPNFLDSRSMARHFEVHVDETDRATLVFGNGTLGTAPRGRLDITYKTGGGQHSNVEMHSLSVTDSPLLTASGQPVVFRVSNPSAAEGGSDRESIESIKRRAPESLRVAHRTITREDFEINARKVPGVARALMLTSNETADIEENTGRLLIVPDAGGALTDELKARVHRQVTHEYPCTLTFQVDVEAPKYVPINIEADIQTTETTPASGLHMASHSVTEAVHRALSGRFRITRTDGSPNEKVDFGYYARGAATHSGDVAWSDIVSVICAVPAVRKVGQVKLNGSQQDVVLEPYAFPVLGQVTIRHMKDS